MPKQAIEQQLRVFRTDVRMATHPNDPCIIGEWLRIDRCCDQHDNHRVCPHCPFSTQRRCYEQQFRLLLETIADELLAPQWRCSCLDRIHHPLQGLKSLANTPDSTAHLRELRQELATISYYVRYGLSH